MPAKSKAQERLFAAADHGATFPMAQMLRKTTTHTPRADFIGSTTGKPVHVRHPHRNLGGYLHPQKAR